jgi:ABC-2 type transport system ATP-binding protein
LLRNKLQFTWILLSVVIIVGNDIGKQGEYMKLEVHKVSKVYRGGAQVLTDINLDIKPGVLGLLGENGAGKSTLMRILSTITRQTTGEVLWNGIDIGKSPDALRAILGYLPQDFGVYPHLNAVEFLEYMAAVKGVNRKDARSRIEQLLKLVNLYDVRKIPLGRYSGGMRQRVGIAQALLNNPLLLIVDEPTVGLDPVERVRFRNLLSDLSGERIVIFSTHIVSDLEATAEKIAILSHGRLIEQSSPDQLLKLVQGKVWEWTLPASEIHALREQWIVVGTVRTQFGIQARLVADVKPDEEARAVAPGLEDAYLYCTARSRVQREGEQS